MRCQNGVLYVNHLAYADDTIVFTSSDEESMRLVIYTLASYEKVSGHKINNGKSVVSMHQQVTQDINNLVYNATQIPRKEFHSLILYKIRWLNVERK